MEIEAPSKCWLTTSIFGSWLPISTHKLWKIGPVFPVWNSTHMSINRDERWKKFMSTLCPTHRILSSYSILSWILSTFCIHAISLTLNRLQGATLCSKLDLFSSLKLQANPSERLWSVNLCYWKSHLDKRPFGMCPGKSNNIVSTNLLHFQT